MKRPQRWRWRCGFRYAGLAMCVALLATWLWSGWGYLLISTPTTSFVLTRGQCELTVGESFSPRPIHCESEFGSEGAWWAWGFEASSVPGADRRFSVPIWAALVPVMVATGWSWWGRRIPAGCRCKCGYPREGLVPGAVCPECGSAPRATGSRT
jgi:hypothetical protein